MNDTTQCAYCRICIVKWKSDSIPNEVHINLFPESPHIKHLIQTNSIYNSVENFVQEINYEPEDIIDIENEVQSNSKIN